MRGVSAPSEAAAIVVPRCTMAPSGGGGTYSRSDYGRHAPLLPHLLTLQLLLCGTCGFLPGAAATTGTAAAIVPGPDALRLDWGYLPHFPSHGPAAWAQRYPDCGGAEQSPVDIHLGVTAAPADAHLLPLDLRYPPAVAAYDVVNRQTALCVEFAAGVGDAAGVLVDPNVPGYDAAGRPGKHYTLREIRLHVPAEHSVGGGRADMEAQLVHEEVHADGRGAAEVVVAILFTTGLAPNTALRGLWSGAALPTLPDPSFSFYEGTRSLGPRQVGPERAHATRVHGRSSLHLRGLIPARHDYATYEGSHTTPPCVEGVRYYVFERPVQVGAAQVNATRAALGIDAETAWLRSNASHSAGVIPSGFDVTGNARPAQPLGNRVVRRYTDVPRTVITRTARSDYTLELIGCIFSSVVFTALVLKLLFAP